MSDCYLPTLENFKFTADEETVISQALLNADPWDSEDNDELKAIKGRIRDYHLQRHKYTCCYCRAGLRGRGNFTIDREHILPKKKYKNLTFAMSNLSVSCKRCNMEYKKNKIDFVINSATVEAAHTDSSRYRFVHPNYDNWSDHLSRIGFQYDTFELVVFRVLGGSEKGDYTYRYFKFDRYCAESLDIAQGIQGMDEMGLELLNQLAGSLGIELP